jgi:hypothetical protein
MNIVQVFVGFGGSGGKTLAKLAEFIADDALLADRGERHFFFLLADTDQADLDASERAILDEFARVRGARPHVKKLVLSRGTGRVMDLIDDAMGAELTREHKDKRRSPALETLRKHWPFDASGLPFSAPRLPVPLTRGASQCPLAAHLAAWDSLSRGELAAALEGISDDMVGKLFENNPNTQVDLILVGSLAGGTGRGCWQLLSLAARSVFPRCKPQAYFFDSSVFAQVRGSGRERYRMHVNSLTGLSEIAGWLRNDLKPSATQAAASERFVLPNLYKADTGSPVVDTDSIARAADQKHLIGRSPIDGVFIITGSSDALSVTSPVDAYEIAAAAMFARVAIPKLESKMANDLHIGSCGAAIAKVHVTALEKCLKLRAQMAVTERILASDERRAAEVAALIIDPLKFSPEVAADISSASPESFLGKLKSSFDTVDLGGLNKALKDDQSKSDVQKAIATLACMSSDPSTVRAYLNAAVKEQCQSESASTASGAFRNALQRQLKRLIEAQASPGQMLSVLTRVSEELQRLRSYLPAPGSFVEGVRAGEIQRIDAELDRCEGREYKIVGARWNKTETGQIQQCVRDASARIHGKEVVLQLRELLDEWAAIVHEYVVVVRPSVKAAEALYRDFSDRFRSMREEHFLPSSFAALQRAFGDWTSKKAKAMRILRPALSDDQLHALVDGMVDQAGGSVALGMAKFREQLADSLGNKDVRKSLGNEVEATRAQQEREEFLDREVFGGLSVASSVMQQHFGVLPVVKSIEQRVRTALDQNQGDSTGTEELQDAFEAMFGVRFRRVVRANTGKEENRYQEIPAAVLVQQLGYSLAQLADPMFRVDRRAIDAKDRPEVDHDAATTYFPGAVCAKSEASQFLEGAKRADELPKDAARQFSRTSVSRYAVDIVQDGLPYCILANSTYTIPGFEKAGWDPVKSFAFWKQDPEVTKWLARCETATLDGVWETEDGNFGLGYMHPMFVTDPWREHREPSGAYVKGLRWAPWGVSAESLRQRADELDAILYALAGNMPSRDNGIVKQARSVVDRVGRCEPSMGSGERWLMPLLRRGREGDENCWVFQRGSFRAEAGHVMASGGNWKTAGGAFKSFNTLSEFIKWIGGPNTANLSGDGRVFVDAVNGERRLLHSSVILEIEDDFGAHRRESLNTALLSFLDEYRDNYLQQRAAEQKDREMPLLEALRARISALQWSWDGPPSA